jgi:hypothetical protein
MDTKQFCYVSTPPQSSTLIVLAMSPSLEEELCTDSDWHGNMSLLSHMYFKCKLASKESHNSYNSLPLARWEAHSVDDSFRCQLRANNHIQYILSKFSHSKQSILSRMVFSSPKLRATSSRTRRSVHWCTSFPSNEAATTVTGSPPRATPSASTIGNPRWNIRYQQRATSSLGFGVLSLLHLPPFLCVLPGILINTVHKSAVDLFRTVTTIIGEQSLRQSPPE